MLTVVVAAQTGPTKYVYATLPLPTSCGYRGPCLPKASRSSRYVPRSWAAEITSDMFRDGSWCAAGIRCGYRCTGASETQRVPPGQHDAKA